MNDFLNATPRCVPRGRGIALVPRGSFASGYLTPPPLPFLCVFPQPPGGSWLTTNKWIQKSRIYCLHCHMDRDRVAHQPTHPRTHTYAQARRGNSRRIRVFESNRRQTMASPRILQQHLLLPSAVFDCSLFCRFYPKGWLRPVPATPCPEQKRR